MSLVDSKTNDLNVYRFCRRMEIYRSHHEQNYKKYLPVWDEEIKVRREETNQLYKRWLEHQAKCNGGKSKVDPNNSGNGLPKKVKRRLSTNQEGNQPMVPNTSSSISQSNVENFQNSFKYSKVNKIIPQNQNYNFNVHGKAYQNGTNSMKMNYQPLANVNANDINTTNKNLVEQSNNNNPMMSTAMSVVSSTADNSLDNKALEDDFSDIKDLLEFLNSDKDIPEDILQENEKEITPQGDIYNVKGNDPEEILSDSLSGYRNYYPNFLEESAATDFLAADLSDPNKNNNNNNNNNNGITNFVDIDMKSTSNTTSTDISSLEQSTTATSNQSHVDLNNVPNSIVNYKVGSICTIASDASTINNNNDNGNLGSAIQYPLNQMNQTHAYNKIIDCSGSLPAYNEAVVMNQSINNTINNYKLSNNISMTDNQNTNRSPPTNQHNSNFNTYTYQNHYQHQHHHQNHMQTNFQNVDMSINGNTHNINNTLNNTILKNNYNNIYPNTYTRTNEYPSAIQPFQSNLNPPSTVFYAYNDVYDNNSVNYFNSNNINNNINNNSIDNNINNSNINNNSINSQYIQCHNNWVDGVYVANHNSQSINQHYNNIQVNQITNNMNNKYTDQTMQSHLANNESMLHMLHQPYTTQHQSVSCYQYNINNNDNIGNVNSANYYDNNMNVMGMMMSNDNADQRSSEVMGHHHMIPMSSSSSLHSSSSSSCVIASASSPSSLSTHCLDHSSERDLSLIDDIINGKK